MQTCICGSQKLTSDVYLSCSAPYFMRHGLFMNLKLPDSVSLAGLHAPGIPFVSPVGIEVPTLSWVVGTGNLSSSRHKCGAKDLAS